MKLPAELDQVQNTSLDEIPQEQSRAIWDRIRRRKKQPPVPVSKFGSSI